MLLHFEKIAWCGFHNLAYDTYTMVANSSLTLIHCSSVCLYACFCDGLSVYECAAALYMAAFMTVYRHVYGIEATSHVWVCVWWSRGEAPVVCPVELQHTVNGIRYTVYDLQAHTVLLHLELKRSVSYRRHALYSALYGKYMHGYRYPRVFWGPNRTSKIAFI